MPLQQINVSPAESSKNGAFSDQQMCQPDFTGRSDSQMSSESSGSTSVEICRICHCEGDAEAGLIAPCYCAGSLRYVHQICLQQWIKSSNTRCCELCRFQFIMHTKTKPFTEWEPLEMNGFERRKLVCAVMFHAIALTCVVWSLYVLIDRTAEEIKQGLLEWPFWTKLIVVAIGFTGGLVFMYIQCKAYMQICQRWKAYNRVIYVQNAPEKQPLSISRVSTAQASKQSSSDYHPSDSCRTDQPKPYSDSGGSNGKDETSIDLKGIRNVHIFFKDENQVTFQNGTDNTEENGPCGLSEGSTACVPRGAARLDPDQTPAMWHIKIGKGVSNDSSSSLRCNETESQGEPRGGNEVKEENHQVVASRSDRDVCDPVLKLQINKAEIVIKFGQGEVSSEETLDKNTSSKDTSVNIKIDDKESEPIVIDLVKKAPVEQQPKIRFDFSDRANSETEDSKLFDEGNRAESSSDPKLHERVREALYSDLLDRCAESTANDSYPSGTDSGSQSPLLLPKNLE